MKLYKEAEKLYSEVIDKSQVLMGEDNYMMNIAIEALARVI